MSKPGGAAKLNIVDELQLLIDLHENGPRQGPGGDRETRLAVALSGLNRASGLRIADIGCGTGASTLVLARELDAHLTAVDFIPEFLARLEDAAGRAGLSDRITTLCASMESLPFAESVYDAIWSEGAIYNMGFAAGITAWRRYLKPGGVLAVSELTWLTDQTITIGRCSSAFPIIWIVTRARQGRGWSWQLKRKKSRCTSATRPS